VFQPLTNRISIVLGSTESTFSAGYILTSTYLLWYHHYIFVHFSYIPPQIWIKQIEITTLPTENTLVLYSIIYSVPNVPWLLSPPAQLSLTHRGTYPWSSSLKPLNVSFRRQLSEEETEDEQPFTDNENEILEEPIPVRHWIPISMIIIQGQNQTTSRISCFGKP